MEYTDEGVKDRIHPALSAKVAPMVASEPKDTALDSVSMHSKGEQPAASIA